MKNRYDCVLWCIILLGCGSKGLSVDELQHYISDSDHGLRKEVIAGDVTMEVIYKPVDLIVSQEIQGKAIDSSMLASIRNKYSSYHYFTLRLSRGDKEALHQTDGMGQYSHLVNVMSFHMAEFVRLTTASQDTIPVGDFMLDRTYGLNTSTDILFLFIKEKVNGREWIEFQVDEFGLGVGMQRFRFRTKDLVEIPEVEFNIIQ